MVQLVFKNYPACFAEQLDVPHNNDVIMGAIASQMTSLTIVYSTVHSDADHRKHESSASLEFVRGIHRGPVNSPHKWPVTRKMFPFDDVIMPYVAVSLLLITASYENVQIWNNFGTWRQYNWFLLNLRLNSWTSCHRQDTNISYRVCTKRQADMINVRYVFKLCATNTFMQIIEMGLFSKDPYIPHTLYDDIALHSKFQEYLYVTVKASCQATFLYYELKSYF